MSHTRRSSFIQRHSLTAVMISLASVGGVIAGSPRTEPAKGTSVQGSVTNRSFQTRQRRPTTIAQPDPGGRSSGDAGTLQVDEARWGAAALPRSFEIRHRRPTTIAQPDPGGIASDDQETLRLDEARMGEDKVCDGRGSETGLRSLLGSERRLIDRAHAAVQASAAAASASTLAPRLERQAWVLFDADDAGGPQARGGFSLRFP